MEEERIPEFELALKNIKCDKIERREKNFRRYNGNPHFYHGSTRKYCIVGLLVFQRKTDIILNVKGNTERVAFSTSISR